jgi:hypothetical protein
MNRQARTGDTVLAKSREMTGRSQTLPWYYYYYYYYIITLATLVESNLLEGEGGKGGNKEVIKTSSSCS